MIYEIFVMVLWWIITLVLLVNQNINIEFAYIGMCIMLAAELLYKEE